MAHSHNLSIAAAAFVQAPDDRQVQAADSAFGLSSGAKNGKHRAELRTSWPAGVDHWPLVHTLESEYLQLPVTS